ncbi:MAG TPA: APC family permease [Solirubrobacteraceae bacterium]|nr:APC family permease [Solirubrobacteraceae bacterium]
MSAEAEHRTSGSDRDRGRGRRLYRLVDRDTPPRRGKHAEEGHDLGVIKGLAALSLDALSSVAYGPEAIMLALVAAGTSALSAVLPISVVITAMLAILVVSYTQVIAAHPEGGGAYAVAKANLGHWPSLLAAASVVVDYVLTVAVSLAAGAASLASAIHPLAHHLLLVSLAGLLILTVVNMFGISESARLLVVPGAIFLISVFATIVLGAVDWHSPHVGSSLGPFTPTEALGVVLILKAFAAGCSAVTGVEAISNGVPAFKHPTVQNAQRTMISLGVLLGTMLVGLSILIRAHDVLPRGGGHGPRPAQRGCVRHRLAVLRLELCGHRGSGCGGQHQLRRAARFDEPAGA